MGLLAPWLVPVSIQGPGPVGGRCQAGLPTPWLPRPQRRCGLPPRLCLHRTLQPLLCDSRPGSGVLVSAGTLGTPDPALDPWWAFGKCADGHRWPRPGGILGRPGLRAVGDPGQLVSYRRCRRLITCRRTSSLICVVSRQCLACLGPKGPSQGPGGPPKCCSVTCLRTPFSPESIAGIKRKSRLPG